MHLPHNPTQIPFPSPHPHPQTLTNLTFILSIVSISQIPQNPFPISTNMAIQTIQQQQQEPNWTRSYWRWSKQDFFPEPSFSNLTSNKTSLSQTCPRLKDRLLDCSNDTFTSSFKKPAKTTCTSSGDSGNFVQGVLILLWKNFESFRDVLVNTG